jgi:putative FmdB family regulatory protein
MPFYDYACKDCQERFSKILTLNEYNRGDVKCPKCGSGNVEQVPSSFFAVTSRKS